MRREIIQLSVLIALAAAAFFVTRIVAASNREMSSRDAIEWHRRGQTELDRGQIAAAIESFRRATIRDQSNPRYPLALARAQALHGDADAAERTLMSRRELTPEEPDVNLELARLAGRRDDVTNALRFYHTALDAWTSASEQDARRRSRLELIAFLLAHAQTSTALAELLALTADLPDEPAARLQTATLFAKAGDHPHALEEFQRVLRLAPDHAEALAGAGQAAFQLGDYALARSYFQRLPAAARGRAGGTRELVDLVLAHDPLANHLGSAERRRRLTADFAYARGRLTQCLDRNPGNPPADDDLATRNDARALEAQLNRSAILEQDAIENGVDLIDRMVRHATRRCGPARALDQALVLIGRKHGADAR